MKIVPLLFCALTIFSLSSLPAQAAEEKKFPETEWNANYLNFIDRDKIAKKQSLLNDPPAEGSADFKREIDYLEVVTTARSKKQEELFREIGNDPVLHFVKTLGFDDPKFENVKRLFYNTLVQLNPRVLEEKWRYQRQRPYQASDRVKLLGEKAITASYPSLYAAQASTIAHIMTDLYPQYDYIWAGWAKEISKLYEVAGLQFPTDTDGGRIISLLVYERYKKTIEFKSDFLNADIELLDYEIDIKAFEEKFGTFNLPKSFP